MNHSISQKNSLLKYLNEESIQTIKLIKFFKFPSVFWDERFSTDIIYKELRKSNISKTKIKNKLDQQSASYILQGYLNRYSNKN